VAKKKLYPTINKITIYDIRAALNDGFADLKNAGFFSIFFGLFYAVTGWILLYLVFTFEISIYAYPLTMGFPLIAPFIAAGLYEISRRLSKGQKLAWPGILTSVKNAGGNDLSWMAVITVFAYIIWVDVAAAIYIGFFGLKKMEIGTLLELVFTTPKGMMFFVVGNTVGAILGTVMFSLTSTSFPLLFDRGLDFVSAMITSVKAVNKNKVPMLFWAATIFVLMAFSVATVFVGLIFVLPLLGHTTWHVYKRIIAPAEN
ncbi:MAG: DUF2189 domain-containing protein, partial [Hyphomicrobiales bacterium]